MLDAHCYGASVDDREMEIYNLWIASLLKLQWKQTLWKSDLRL